MNEGAAGRQPKAVAARPPAKRLAAPPDLRDPGTCGEDLIANAERVLAVAPTACDGCAGYHVRTVLHRCAGIAKGIMVDRPVLIAAIHGAMTASVQRPMRVLIAGAADTGILATCAHAAAMAGIACQFMVADRCATPLALCRQFGEDHALDVETMRTSLEMLSLAPPADLIVVHSLLRFMTPEEQVTVLRCLANTLAPNGKLLVSMRLKDGTAAEAAGELRKRQLASTEVRRLLHGGLIQARQSAGEIMALIDGAVADDQNRPGEMNSPRELEALAAEAGLAVESSAEGHWQVGVGHGPDVARRRALLVLRRKGE